MIQQATTVIVLTKSVVHYLTENVPKYDEAAAKRPRRILFAFGTVL